MARCLDLTTHIKSDDLQFFGFDANERFILISTSCQSVFHITSRKQVINATPNGNQRHKKDAGKLNR